MDPFLALKSLATDIKHVVLQRSELEMSLRNAGDP
jgi:hypothetical protein